MNQTRDIAAMRRSAQAHATQVRATLSVGAQAAGSRIEAARHYAKCGGVYVATFVRAFFGK